MTDSVRSPSLPFADGGLRRRLDPFRCCPAA